MQLRAYIMMSVCRGRECCWETFKIDQFTSRIKWMKQYITRMPSSDIFTPMFNERCRYDVATKKRELQEKRSYKNPEFDQDSALGTVVSAATIRIVSAAPLPPNTPAPQTSNEYTANYPHTQTLPSCTDHDLSAVAFTLKASVHLSIRTHHWARRPDVDYHGPFIAHDACAPGVPRSTEQPNVNQLTNKAPSIGAWKLANPHSPAPTAVHTTTVPRVTTPKLRETGPRGKRLSTDSSIHSREPNRPATQVAKPQPNIISSHDCETMEIKTS